MLIKKIITISIITFLNLSIGSYNYALDSIVNKEIIMKIGSRKITIDQNEIVLNTAPIIRDGITLVPIRSIGEAFGGKVTWNSKENKILIDFESDIIYLWIDKKIGLVNGEEVSIEEAPFLYDNTTMVPIRFLAENLGYNIKWNGATNTITINNGNKTSKSMPVDTKNSYKVVEGDSLWKISNKFNIEIDDLKKINNLDGDVINKGDYLLIIDTNTNTKTNANPTTINNNPDYYVVKKGDTLWDISNKYGISIDKIMSVNNLIDTNIFISQNIILTGTSNGKIVSQNKDNGKYSFQGKIVYFNQGDQRWGNKMYSITNNSKQTIATSGCGPTSMAMVISSFGMNLLPDGASEKAIKFNSRTPNNGTSLDYFGKMAKEYNLNMLLKNSKQDVIDILKTGKYMCITSTGSGHFTSQGHYLVLYGLEYLN
ncbi:MAG: stalk domain-containing protein, partial [Clostridiales bacterium]